MQIQRDLGVALMVRPDHAGQQLVGGRADEPDREPPLLATCGPAGRRPGLLARLGQPPHPLVKHLPGMGQRHRPARPPEQPVLFTSQVLLDAGSRKDFDTLSSQVRNTFLCLDTASIKIAVTTSG